MMAEVSRNTYDTKILNNNDVHKLVRVSFFILTYVTVQCTENRVYQNT